MEILHGRDARLLYDLAEYTDEPINSEDTYAESLIHYLLFVEDESLSMTDALYENCEHHMFDTTK